jgi:inorganic phosphate transporter, PiT family
LTIEFTLLLVVYGTIVTALFFDFVNGFHDSANAIATVVGTRVLKPLQAVVIAAIGNFVGPFIFGTAVAATGPVNLSIKL